jgi:phosphoribosylformylglycinamidine synthase subunit PurQ / glutaminase
LKSAVIVFPGSNRERDAAAALAAFGAPPALVWHRDHELPRSDLILIPGGFSYGDYLRTGAIARFSPIMRAVADFAAHGGLVLGICNGFQILTESGLLPGVLLRNASLKFVCRDVHLKVETSSSPFTRAYNAGQVLTVPIAHGDGNYFADEATLKRLQDEDRIAFRYCSPHEGGSGNPNGSIADIAGILNERRNVLGLMPHPENAVDPMLGSTDGRGLFQSLVEALAA